MNKEDKVRKRKDNGVRGVTDDKIKQKYTKKYESITAGTQPKHHKWWTAFVVLASVVVVVHFFKPQRDVKLAVHNEVIPIRFHKKECSQQLLNEIKDYPTCVPKQCGRLVSDSLISADEVNILLATAKVGIGLAGSSGGASILDLHSGALSKGEGFINAYDIPQFRNFLSEDFINAYKSVTWKIKKSIAENFVVDENHLYLTHPTFFSRINNITAKTVHDEYWHPHVDKDQYESFHYTSLLYLNTYKKDFQGGRFIFIDGHGKNETTFSIEPKSGRVNAFTSGHENVHHIETVSFGTRFAITISFTCDSKLEVNNNFTARYDG